MGPLLFTCLLSWIYNNAAHAEISNPAKKIKGLDFLEVIFNRVDFKSAFIELPDKIQLALIILSSDSFMLIITI
jgi:hypothetical protein